jgi:hypothetical protein
MIKAFSFFAYDGVLAWKFKFTNLLRCARRRERDLQGMTLELQISAVKCH